MNSTKVKNAGIALLILAGTLLAAQVGQAQVFIAPPPVVTYSSPVVVQPALAPTTVQYSYYPPTTSFYAPPTTSYYVAPTTSFYAAPVTAYSAPVVTPGYVTTTGTVQTRSYFGLGVFRPFGWNTQSTFTPNTVTVTPSTSFYTPVIIR